MSFRPNELSRTSEGVGAGINSGGQRDVLHYINTLGFKKVISIGRAPIFIDENRLTKTLYSMNLLHYIFPQNFPKWTLVGRNKDYREVTIRVKIEGDFKPIGREINIHSKGEYPQLEEITEFFTNLGISLDIDFANRENVVLSKDHKDKEVYLDSALLRIDSEVKYLRLLEKINSSENMPEENKSMARLALFGLYKSFQKDSLRQRAKNGISGIRDKLASYVRRK